MEASIATTSLPTYKIFRDKHGIPQFSPKRGTQALTDALSYTFPALSTELELMQAALRKFFDSERGSKFVFELPQNDLQVSLAKPSPKGEGIWPIEEGRAGLRSSKLPLASNGARRGRRGSRASSRCSSRPPSRPLSRVSSRAETPTRPCTPADDGLGGKLMTWVLASGQELKGAKKQPYDPVKRRKVAENRGNVCDKHRASKTACDPEICPQNKGYGKAVEEVLKDTSELVGGYSSLPTVKEIRTGEASSKATEAASPLLDGSEMLPVSNGLLTDEVDLFWEAPEHPDVFFQSDNSPFPSFDHSSSSATPSSKLETSHSNDTSMSSYHSSAFNERSFNFANGIGADLEPGADMGASFGQELYHPPPAMVDECQIPYNERFESSNQWFPQNVPPPSSKTLAGSYSDDPFMGWASKRSSQMCQDYGWVLSHVETL